MRVTIFDRRRDLITERVRRALDPMGIRPRVIEALEDLRFLPGADEADVLIVNLAGGGVTGWHVSRELESTRFCGRVLVFAEDLSAPDVKHLAQIPRVKCVPTPHSPTAADEAIAELLTPGDGLPAVPAQPAPPRGRYGIIGRSRPMLEIFSRIEKVASGDANVWIYGESGTGKELIAYAIHQASARRHGPFVPLDCTAIPEGLMESHLFGHVKGAFTGAVDNRDGVFSLAHTGTLFIDELCELSLPLQAKLLRVVESREFYKVGGMKALRSDTRLIAATNREPKQEVEKGNFREDLYYRLAVVMIRVPPLRERREDIPLLVDHFITQFSSVYRKRIRGVEPAAMERIIAAPWPGNVRELENFIEQAVVLTEGDVLRARDLFPEGPARPVGVSLPGLELEPGLPLREVERRYILRTLQEVGESRTEAARRLGISLRCLQYKLKSYMAELARVDPVESPAAASEIPVRPAGRLRA
jgi:DNA-binding NtrC family response regulator